MFVKSLGVSHSNCDELVMGQEVVEILTTTAVHLTKVYSIRAVIEFQ